MANNIVKRFLTALVVLFSLTLPVSAANVGSLTTLGAPAGATFTLATNPGNYFSIVGTEIVANQNTPPGQYNISVQACCDTYGRTINRTLVLNYAGSGIPPGVFSVGINLVGGEATFPTFATTAQINYHAARLHGTLNPKPKFRFTLGWSQVNNDQQYNSNNHLVGIQPVAFGPLDTTSTVYSGGSYVAAMNRVISDVMAAGGQVLLDIHMFGAGPGGNVGSVACPFSCFGDLWGKIADYYVHVRPDLLPGIYGFDLMNEWKFIDSAIAFNGNQAAIAAARLNGYLGPIYVEGVNFSSAWNWTSGQTQSFNNSNLFQLVDPLNNLISSAHMYPDPDDSGSQGAQSFAYNVAVVTAGSAPTGLNVNPTIAVTRIAREWQPWLVQHKLRGHVGEYGTSLDNPWIQGLFDYPDWNTITRNLLTYLQANNIEINLWASGNGGAGYGPNGYAYSLDPFSADLSGTFDFTGTGIQAPVWTVLDPFTGHTGPQPTAYALFQPGLVSPALYIGVNTPSQPFTIYYGGKITSPVTITPHDFLTDRTTPANGTFTPATITLAAGDNGLAAFTYTASQAATLVISTTNNAAWHDPPVIGLSSTTDDFQTAVNQSTMVALRRVVSTYIGPAITLISPADGVTQQTFFFNNRGDLPRQAIQDFANTRTGIKIARLYSQNGNPAGDIVPLAVSQFFTPSLANPMTLTLVNAAGYPEVNVTSGQWAGTQAFSSGRGLLTIAARANGAGTLASQDIFSGQFRLSTSAGFFAGANGSPGGFVSTGTVSGYTDIAGTYSNLYTPNNQKGYNSGSSVASATPGQFTFAPQFPQTGDTWVNSFRFGGQDYVGTWQEAVVTFDELSSSVVSNIHTHNNTYYATPLPDPLSGLSPVVAGVLQNFPIYPGIITARPFGLLSVTDANGGSPTETVTITLSGAAGTLSGSGISGSGPYTVGPDTPANVTTTLNQAVFTTAAGVGSSTTFSVHVVSSAGTGTTNSLSNTIVTTWAQAALTPPGGTFTPVNHSGYNFAGGELDPSFGLGPKPFQIDYLASKSFGLMRYVVSSRYFYTSAFGPLDPSFLATMKAVIDYAFTKNIYVVIDPHTSGFTFDPVLATGVLVTPNMRSQDLFQDSWRRLAAAFVNYPNVIFGLMNEPGQTAIAWRDGAVTPSITAIRAAGATQLILIPGVGASSALGWASNGNSAAFAGYVGDPLNNFAFETHQYLDSGASGSSPVSTISGATALNTFNTFLSTNGFKGFLGEFGMSWDPWFPITAGSNELFDATRASPQTTNNVTQYTAMLNSAIATGNYVGWAEWGGGNEFGTPPSQNGYYFQPEPQKASGSAYIIPLVEQPFIGVLQSKVIP